MWTLECDVKSGEGIRMILTSEDFLYNIGKIPYLSDQTSPYFITLEGISKPLWRSTLKEGPGRKGQALLRLDSLIRALACFVL